MFRTVYNSFTSIVSNTIENSSELTLCIPIKWCHRKVKSITFLKDQWNLKKYEQVIQEICLIAIAIFAYIPSLILGIASTSWNLKKFKTNCSNDQSEEAKVKEWSVTIFVQEQTFNKKKEFAEAKNTSNQEEKEKKSNDFSSHAIFSLCLQHQNFENEKAENEKNFINVVESSNKKNNQKENNLESNFEPREKGNSKENESVNSREKNKPKQAPQKPNRPNPLPKRETFEADKLNLIKTSIELTKLAIKYYQRPDVKNRKVPSLRHLDILGQNAADVSILQEIFKQFRGFGLGEIHTDPAPKKFLLDNLEDLKKIGVKYIFYEGLNFQQQWILDSYFYDKKDTSETVFDNLFNDLSRRTKTTDPRYTDLAVIKKAKQVGIRIIATDTDWGTYNRHEESNIEIHRIQMNYAMAVIAEKYLMQDPSAKFIAWMGINHLVATMPLVTIPGVSELLECPNIIVKTKKTQNIANIQYEGFYSNRIEGNKFHGRLNMLISN